MKKKCIALLLAAFMLISPGASAFAETAEQPATEIYETTESADADTEVLEAEISDTETESTETEGTETEISEPEGTETESSGTEISETETAETESTETETTETETTETESTETESTETETTETEIPDTEIPDTEISETETTETETTETIMDITSDDLLDGLTTEETETEEVTYKVSFNANGGKGTMTPQTFQTGASAKLTANTFTRKGYTFTGWALAKNAKVTLKDKATLNPDTAKWDKNNSLTLYAQWKATEYSIVYKLNKGTNNKSNPSVYTITTKTIKLKNPSRKNYAFAGWYKDKNFKNKVTEIKKGSTGKITLYAKWEKEYKATSTSAKITSCKATGVNTIKVNATISKRVKSSDSKYYLVTIDPNSDKILRKVAQTGKAEKISFKLDTSKDRGYALSKYAIAVKSGKKYVKISKTSSNISNPEKLAAYTKAYDLGSTKKGIQGSASEAKTTGCDNVFFNLMVSTVINGGTPYKYNGKTYYFNTGGCSGGIQEACAAGMNVTVQVMLDAAAYNADPSLVAKEARSSGHPFYTWNTKDKAAREKMEAMFCFLAESFGTDDRYVSNWILGNEVNADYAYNWRGSMSNDAFISSYAYSFRALYSAVRSVRSSSRVFICMDDMWTHKNTGGGIATKTFLDTFVKKVNKLQKNVSWNIAFHPYTAKITDPAFWSDSSNYGLNYLVTNSADSPFVTMRNLNVLTDYVKKTYGKEHRVIISEIGFNAGNPSSNTTQAAALAYAYNKAACNDMVDAFIIRSYVDDASEAAQGLHFGIKGRASYNVFKYMDTKKAEKYTKKYIKTCGGKSNWKSLVSGYSTKKLYTNNGMK